MDFNCSIKILGEQNNTTDSQSTNSTARLSYLPQTLGVLITKYIFLALLTLFGIIGNILVVVVTTKRKAFKSSLDLFIKNLAIADLGFLVLVMPSGVIRTEKPFAWPLGEFVCLYIYPSLDIFHGSSVWIIAAIAVERYRNIVGMARIRRQSQTNRSAKILMVSVWVFSFVAFCIPVYAATVYHKDDQISLCTLSWTKGKDNVIGTNLYLLFLALFSYCIPLGIVTWTYFAISRQLNRSNTFLRGIKGIISRKHAKNISQMNNSLQNFRQNLNLTTNSAAGGNFQNHSLITPADSHRLAQNKRAKNILTPVAVLFAVSMLPINLLRVVLIFWKGIILEKYYSILLFLAVIFTAANSSLNPLLYSIVSREFRNALKSLFKKTRRVLSKSSASGFDGQESTEHKRIDLSEAPAAKDSEEPAKTTNDLSLCVATDTKL